MNKTIFVTLMVIILAGTTGSAFAKSASSSGQSHGCDDAAISNSNHPEDMYILGVNKNGESTGPDHHTNEFMIAYYNGFESCGGDLTVLNNYIDVDYDQVNGGGNNYRNIDDSFNDNSHRQAQNQQAFTSQSAGCPSQIVNGDCIIGQDQNTNNDFAQANRQ